MNHYVLPRVGSHSITLSEAVEMTKRYNYYKKEVLKAEFQDANILCTSETFAVEDIQLMIKETKCKGVRIYYGMKEDKTIHAIFVGVDTEGNDILPSSEQGSSDKILPWIIEEGQRCPPVCPGGYKISLLNKVRLFSQEEATI